MEILCDDGITVDLHCLYIHGLVLGAGPKILLFKLSKMESNQQSWQYDYWVDFVADVFLLFGIDSTCIGCV